MPQYFFCVQWIGFACDLIAFWFALRSSPEVMYQRQCNISLHPLWNFGLKVILMVLIKQEVLNCSVSLPAPWHVQDSGLLSSLVSSLKKLDNKNKHGRITKLHGDSPAPICQPLNDKGNPKQFKQIPEKWLTQYVSYFHKLNILY